MKPRKVSHVGFSDESNWNTKRYRSVSLVSLPVVAVELVETQIRACLSEHRCSEFKWRQLSGFREARIAETLLRIAVDFAVRGDLRVDVLTWDIEDARHKIHRRDDIANLERMYFHIFRWVARNRWQDSLWWKLHPDEHNALDWLTISECLGYASLKKRRDKEFRELFNFRSMLQNEYLISEIVPSKSHESLLLQIADLFGGLSNYSRTRYSDYKSWFVENEPQQSLFETHVEAAQISKRDKTRFEVMASANQLFKKNRLRVSLDTNSRFETLDRRSPINFWPYDQQHPDDKAPTR